MGGQITDFPGLTLTVSISVSPRQENPYSCIRMKELLRKVRRLEIKIRRMVDNTFAGEYHSAFKGQGLEFDEVRPYQFGDDIRSIDWNVTARNGTVFIKQFKEEREQTLFVLFDISGSEEFGKEGASKLQIGTEIAAILSFSALKNNDKIGLATFTDRIERYYKPGKGRKHVLALIRGLIIHQAEKQETRLRAALDFSRKAIRRRSILIVISDFLDTGYEKALTHLSSKHDLILIRLYSPAEMLAGGVGTLPVKDNESGIVRWIHAGDAAYRQKLGERFLAIDSSLAQLSRKFGFGYLNINTEADYIPVLERFFKQRNARVR
jgi:uncharacterized protein (DUF58 family)